MPLVTYETLILLDPTKVSADPEGVKNQIHHIIERYGGSILVSRPWDYNHKLAYPIAKQKKGAYHVVYYTLESTKQKEVERDLSLQEGLVWRQLTLKLDPKWQDIILGVAREDLNPGFAVRGMRDDTAVTTDPTAVGAGDVGMGGTEEPAAAPAPASSPRRGRRTETPEQAE